MEKPDYWHENQRDAAPDEIEQLQDELIYTTDEANKLASAGTRYGLSKIEQAELNRLCDRESTLKAEIAKLQQE